MKNHFMYADDPKIVDHFQISELSINEVLINSKHYNDGEKIYVYQPRVARSYRRTGERANNEKHTLADKPGTNE